MPRLDLSVEEIRRLADILDHGFAPTPAPLENLKRFADSGRSRRSWHGPTARCDEVATIWLEALARWHRPLLKQFRTRRHPWLCLAPLFWDPIPGGDSQSDPEKGAVDQLDSYLETLGLDHGALLIFDRRKAAPPFVERSELSERVHKERRIQVMRL